MKALLYTVFLNDLFAVVDIVGAIRAPIVVNMFNKYIAPNKEKQKKVDNINKP